MVMARLDAYLELMSPAWHGVFGAHTSSNTPLRFLAAGYADPHTLRRLGRARLVKFPLAAFTWCLGRVEAAHLLDAADQTLSLWEDDLDYGELADDIAAEARLALQLTGRSTSSTSAIAVFLHARDPAGIMTSVPGASSTPHRSWLARRSQPLPLPRRCPILQRLGPITQTPRESTGDHGPPTKSGDAPLREALFSSANAARRIDPTLGRPISPAHGPRGQAPQLRPRATSAPVLLSRIVACWRLGTPYLIRDIDGTPLLPDEASASSRALPRLRRSPSPTTGRAQEGGDEPAKQGVAKRSVNRLDPDQMPEPA